MGSELFRSVNPDMRILACVAIALGVGACGTGAARTTTPAPDTTTPAPEAGSPDASATSPKKRKRTAPPSERPYDGTAPGYGAEVNPKDNLGRVVFVRADDQCVVEVASSTEIVDCPPATDDPAWDHCTGLLVRDLTRKCYCMSNAGKPRPKPRPTPCPGAAK